MLTLTRPQAYQTIGVISDVHSNYIALEAVLAEMERRRIEALLFLGDYITDGPSPQRTLSLLREAADRYPSFFIRGNREQYLLHHAQHPEEVWESGTSQGALLYTFQRLTPEDLLWFQRMPLCHSFTDGIVVCHGSPAHISELLSVDGSNSESNEQTQQWIRQLQHPLLLCGHTHRQGLTQNNGKTIVGAGSVGLPHNHDALARAALLHRTKDGGFEPELLAVPYDTEAMIQAYHQSELMEMSLYWTLANCQFIRTGHNYTWRLIRKVTQLASEEYGSSIDQTKTFPLESIPSVFWEEACRQIGLL